MPAPCQARRACRVRTGSMEWWHLPIRDGRSPPARGFEDRWEIAGEALRDRLRLGFDVLVHCRGGLGRAGTVAARLLAELGLALALADSLAASETHSPPSPSGSGGTGRAWSPPPPNSPARPTAQRKRWTPAGRSRSCWRRLSPGRRARMFWRRDRLREQRRSRRSWPVAGADAHGRRSAPAGTSSTPWKPPSGRSPAPATRYSGAGR